MSTMWSPAVLPFTLGPFDKVDDLRRRADIADDVRVVALDDLDSVVRCQKLFEALIDELSTVAMDESLRPHPAGLAVEAAEMLTFEARGY